MVVTYTKMIFSLMVSQLINAEYTGIFDMDCFEEFEKFQSRFGLMFFILFELFFCKKNTS